MKAKVKDLIPDDKNFTFIYGLFCPISTKIRYVGKSNNPRVRYSRHLKNAKSGDSFHCPSWIRSLLSSNQKPILKIIEKCHIENWKDREVYWINHFREQGCDLTNCKNGGDGIGILSEATRNKMRSAKYGNKIHKGYRVNDEGKKRMSEAAIRKFKLNPKLKDAIRENQKKAIEKTRSLTDEQVLKVRGLLAAKVKMPKIASDFGVSYSVIESIRWNKNYAHVR